MEEDKLVCISYSWKADWDWCPRMFNYRRIKKYKPDKKLSDAAVIGIALHDLFKIFYRSRNFTLDFLLTAWPGILKLHIVQLKISVDKNYEKFLVVGEKIIRKFYDMAEKKGLLVDAMLMEETVEYVIKSEAGRRFKVKAIIDLVLSPKDKDEIWIIDFKTGSHIPTEADIRKHDQATFYSMGMRLVKKIFESKFIFMFPRKEKWIETRRDNQDYKELIQKVDQQYLDIQAEKFEPTYKNCFMCQFPERCKNEDLKKKAPGLDEGWFK